MTIRPIDLDSDYGMLEKWWAGHNSLPVPRIILRRGWIAEAGIPIAASFLYVTDGDIGIIEWTTTNPACAFSRDLVEAVRSLLNHLESVASNSGCVAVISFVAPDTGEERIMTKLGYVCTPDSKFHRMYAKPIAAKEAACLSH